MIDICTTLGGNVGKPNCPVRMKAIKYMIFSKGLVLTDAELLTSTATRAALLAAFLRASSDDSKLFIFPKMRVAEDGTPDAIEETLADGYSEVLNEGLPTYNLQSTASVCEQQAMAGFNGWQDQVFIVDTDNVLWYVKTDGGGVGFTVGSLYTNAPRFGSNTAIVTSKTKLVFGTIEEFKYGVGAVKIDFDPYTLASIVDVTLEEIQDGVGYAFKISGKQSCSETDLYDAFSSLLEDEGAWKITRLDTNADVTVSSVVKDATLRGWTVTAASSPTIATDVDLLIQLRDPSVLAALSPAIRGIEDIEGVIVNKNA